MLSSLLFPLLHGFRALSRWHRSTVGPRSSIRLRPQVECLEDRQLLAASITEFPIPTPGSGALDIAPGPNGNQWFVEQNAYKVGEITPSGQVTEFAVTGDPVDIYAGPNNSMWFSEFNANLIGAINVGTGQLTEYQIPTAGAGPNGITEGADGNMWFGEYFAGKIGCITPAGQITEYSVGGNPTDLILGGDGNVWFTSYNSDQVGKITPSGQATLYSAPAGAGPAGIVAGADGNLYVTEYDAGKIGQVTPSGTFTEFSIPSAGSQPYAIDAGPGGTIWFAESGTNAIGRMAMNGTFQEYTIPTANSGPRGIDVDPSGNVWWTEYGGNQIGTLTPPAPPSISLSVSYGSGRTVTLTGQITDVNPGGLTVNFSGEVVGSVVTNPDGTFSGTFTASGLGTVQATTTDAQGLQSSMATIPLTDPAPVITSFTATTNDQGITTFSGMVTDEDAAGLVITFGGLPSLTGLTTVVQTDGSFNLSIRLQPGEEGTATAQTTDEWGQVSNEALFVIG